MWKRVWAQGALGVGCDGEVLGFVYLLIRIQQRVSVCVCTLLCVLASCRGADQLHYA